MPVLDDILREQSRAQDDQLLDARKTASWTQTFNGAQSTEALRASRNYADMIDQTISRKMELAAQTDQKAQAIWQKQAEFNEWQRQAPLRDELLKRQVESQGAEVRFKEFKEAQTHAQTARFFDGLASPDAPRPGTPEYKTHVLGLLRNNTGFATTSTGREVLKSLAEEDDVATTLEQVIQASGGQKPSSVTIGKDGGVQQATFREPDKPNDEVAKDYGISTTGFKNATGVRVGKIKDGKFVGDNEGDVVQFANPKGKTPIQVSKSEFDRIRSVTSETSDSPQSGISQEDYAKLKPGDTYQWQGKTLTKK